MEECIARSMMPNAVYVHRYRVDSECLERRALSSLLEIKVCFSLLPFCEVGEYSRFWKMWCKVAFSGNAGNVCKIESFKSIGCSGNA